jgi:hypothetical protein
MSYSFNVRSAGKDAARAAVAAELDKVVEAQPVHSADRNNAEDCFSAMIELIGEPSAGQDVSVSMNGYVQTIDGTATGVSVGVTIHIVDKAK